MNRLLVILLLSLFALPCYGLVVFTDEDATPSVQGDTLFKTANTIATAITTFDDPTLGQQITVLFTDGNTTIDFTGTTLYGNSGVDWTANQNDVLTASYDGANWYCGVSNPSVIDGGLALQNGSLSIGNVTAWERGTCLASGDFHAHGGATLAGYYKFKHGATPAIHAEAGHSAVWVDNNGQLQFCKADGTDHTIGLDADMIKKDGSVPLASDWNIGDNGKILADWISARNGAGLKLSSIDGKGLIVENGGSLASGDLGEGWDYGLTIGRGFSTDFIGILTSTGGEGAFIGVENDYGSVTFNGDAKLSTNAAGELTVNNTLSVTSIADGGLTSYDLKVGDTDGAPTYGMVMFGNAVIGRTSFKSANMDADGAVVFRNLGGPVTGKIEFLFTEAAGNTIRFAIPSSGSGHAIYNARSYLGIGPAPNNTDAVYLPYWQNLGWFHNLDCDTGATGADMGVQDDLEVEGAIYADEVNESTPGAGVTFNSLVIPSGTTPAPSVEGAIFLDTNASVNGSVVIYSNGAWRTVADL